MVKLIRQYFGIRDNSDRSPFGFVEPEGNADYGERVRAVESVLDGNARVLIDRLQREMDKASNDLHYERAGRIRDMIGSVQRTMSESVVSSRFYQDCDAVGFASRGDSGCVVILHAKEGVIQGKVEYPLIHRGDVADSVSLVLSEHYSKRKPPRKLLTPTPLGDSMSDWPQQTPWAVEVRTPKRRVAKLRSMADRNAEIMVRSPRSRSGSLEKAADDAGSNRPVPDHMVCFDMSQTLGMERVGASVVFRKGRPSKEEYRTYRVKSTAQDDLKMMAEVVTRWVKRQEEWPDLLLLDGGETHLSTIESSLEDLGVLGLFRVAALAKREETLFMRDSEPLVLDRRGRAIIHARDEAHRFSNRFHKKRRSKGALADPLEGVEGLGAKKIQALLRHFGGRKGIEHASVRDLREVDGIGKEMAERIRSHLRG